jgi:hypothetical protein
MNGNFPEIALEAYGEAAAALARADERVALNINRPALLARIQLAELEALAHLEGEAIVHEQMALEYGSSPRAWRRWPHAFAQVFAKPLPSPGAPSADLVREWLIGEPVEPEIGPNRFPMEIHAERLTAWGRVAVSAKGQPPLLASADMASAFAWLGPLSRGSTVIGVMLGDRLVGPTLSFSSGGIAAIGIMTKQIPWIGLLGSATDGEEDDISERAIQWRRRLGWLAALTSGGEAVVDLARRVDAWTRRVDEACEGRRSSSRLRQVVDLVAQSPSLTTSQLAKLTKITRQGSTLLLEEACSARLVREVTHGAAFRRYVAAI